MMNLPQFSGAMQSKPVLQIDPRTNEVVKEWVSKSEVERKMRISNYYMTLALKDESKRVDGYCWRYK